MSLLEQLNSRKMKVNQVSVDQADKNEAAKNVGKSLSDKEEEVAIAFPTVKKDKILEKTASEEIYYNIVACIRTGTMREKEILNKLIDPNITSTVDNFSRVFMAYVNEKEQEACRTWMEMSGIDECNLIMKSKRFYGEIDQDEKEAIENDKHIKESFHVNASLKKVNGLNGINCTKKSAQDFMDIELRSNTQISNSYPEDNGMSDITQEHNTNLLNNTKNQKIKYTELIKTFGENGPKIEISLYFIEKILNRCFGRLSKGEPNLQFYPIKVVQYLIKNNFLPNSIIKGGLMKALIERGDWESVSLLLQFSRDIPEKDQVFLLQHLIMLLKTSKVDEGFKKFIEINGDASSLSSSSSLLQYFLPKLMLVKRQKNLMQLHLKQLKVDELLVLFEISCTWLDGYINGSNLNNDLSDSGMFDENRTIKDSSDRSKIMQLQISAPRFSTIIEFLTLLIDAHFLTLILTNDFHSSLQRLLSCTNTLMQSKKQRLNKNETNAVTILEDQHVPKYSIEMLRVFDDAWLMEDSDDENWNVNYR
ncbi:12307_t:CDS:2 [Ambispora leptoticha]|uniref:12307_t:CDS:1 n=1 Tax=Ambispora leptoticha TaxID=144679 RepID=A0A9N9B421_9GLOM|nr:12307_t:CDS:2 [Ambispora leptoticha]